MERNGGNLESETGNHEDDANDQADGGGFRLAEHFGEAVERSRSGKPVDHRTSVEQHAR